MNPTSRSPGASVSRRAMHLALCMLVVLLTASCGGGTEPEVSYQPPYLPVKLVYSEKDGFGIEGQRSLATSFGTFSIGATYSVPRASESEILVVLRNRRTGFDQLYKVRTGGDRFVVELNGSTTVEVVDRQVIIDVTNGSIKSVGFKRARGAVVEEETWFTQRRSDWDKGWDESWYIPYAMTRWAYDDSTINSAYGLGFAWFLVRLTLALFLAAVDTVLTFFFLLGQLAYLAGGPTARNITYGVTVLAFLVVARAVLTN